MKSRDWKKQQEWLSRRRFRKFRNNRLLREPAKLLNRTQEKLNVENRKNNVNLRLKEFNYKNKEKRHEEDNNNKNSNREKIKGSKMN